MILLRSTAFQSALYSIKAILQTTFSTIPPSRLISLIDTHPQLAAAVFWSFASERAVLCERLIDVSRRSASERVAHFLLELLTRLQGIGLADERSYRLPLTQKMISDALGLNIRYVSRVLQELRENGIVRISDRLVIIDRIDELLALAASSLPILSRYR